MIPNLFWWIPPLAHFETFHSSPISQIQQGGCKSSNVIFATTQIARCGLKCNPSSVDVSLQ